MAAAIISVNLSELPEEADTSSGHWYKKYVNKYHEYVKSLNQDSHLEKLAKFFEQGAGCPSQIWNCYCRNRDPEGCSDGAGDHDDCSCNGRRCDCHSIKQTVTVYDIHPNEPFEYPETFDTEQESELERLASKLGPRRSKNEYKVPSNADYRLICVSHLSPNVAKLLGWTYNISADFFNRHLPGTEALSGKLLSYLPSSIQIEFDELYESEEPFERLWPWEDELNGHYYIRQAMKRHFLFWTGWDYFPIGRELFQRSLENSRLSSGYEVLLQNPQLKNVFQFNISHRVSVYNIPDKDPNTAIILFYPKLPMSSRKSEPINFKAIPKQSPDPDNSRKYKSCPWKTPYASVFENEFVNHFKNHFERMQKRDSGDLWAIMRFTTASRKEVPKFIHIFGISLFRVIAENWARLIVRRSFDLDLLEWRPSALLKDETINEAKSRRISIGRHIKDLRAAKDVLASLMQEETQAKITAKKRKTGRLPLDSSSRADGESSDADESTSYEDTKYKNEIRAMSRAEDNNLGRANGFMHDPPDLDSWERIYWDFFELQKEMESLGQRATKIHDGLVAMLQLKLSEHSDDLTKRLSILSVLTLILFAPSIVSSIWNSKVPDHWKEFRNTIKAYGVLYSISCICVGFIWIVPYFNRHIQRKRSKELNDKMKVKAPTGTQQAPYPWWMPDFCANWRKSLIWWWTGQLRKLRDLLDSRLARTNDEQKKAKKNGADKGAKKTGSSFSSSPMEAMTNVTSEGSHGFQC